MLFHKVEGAQCVLRSKGVYRQVDVYERKFELFARWGSGFISLKARNGTSHPDVAWDHIEGVDTFFAPAVGNLTTMPPSKVVQIEVGISKVA